MWLVNSESSHSSVSPAFGLAPGQNRFRRLRWLGTERLYRECNPIS